MDMALIELREELDESLAVFQAAADAIESADDSADLDKLQTSFTEAEERYTKARDDHRKAEDRAARARKRFELMESAKDARKLVEGPAETKVSVGKEPLTYQQHGPYSIFSDLYRSQYAHDSAAAERLSRHQREMQLEGKLKAGAAYDLNSTDATGGYLVPPLWLQEEFVTLARPGRVVIDTLGPRALPPKTDSINLPRMSTGTAVAAQTDNSGVQETDSAFDTISGDVKTIAGLQDVSQQLVDRSIPGVDEVIFADLAKAYGVSIDSKVITNGTANNLGLLDVSGINAVTFTSATPTVALLYPKLADAIQQIHTNVFTPPTAIFMHPRRWAFILAGTDTANRPLVTPYAPQNAVGDHGGVVSQGLVGSVQGVPVYVDANIPTTLGASTNEDRIIVVATPEVYVYEDQSGPYMETFRDVGSGNLTVRFRLHNYWAQINARRPKAISVISGTGLVAPTF